MTTILITGKNGQVGFELQRSLAILGDIVAIDQPDCDFTDPAAIRRLMAQIKPDVVVNPAAYTAVDKAESDPSLANAINADAPRVLGEEAAKTGALVIHYSTDYVFDGTKSSAYVESDQPNPKSVYGKTKYDGEVALVQSGAKHLIFRTSWVFGAHGANFVKTILRLAAERDALNIVADQHGAPTSAALLADITAHVLARYLKTKQQDLPAFPYGLYNLVAGGQTTWCDFAKAIVAAANQSGTSTKASAETIRPITTADYPLPAPRPSNSLLDTSKLKNTFGLQLPEWQHGLEHTLALIL